MKRIAWMAAAVLLGMIPLAAQHAPPYQDPLLDRLAGEWVLAGTIDGQATTHDCSAAWVLGHQYLRFTEVSREKDAAGKPVYEAEVVVGMDPAGPGYACLWLDNTGPQGLNGKAIGKAPPSQEKLAFVFTAGDGSLFRTTFAYVAASDSWTGTMDAEVKGQLIPFARFTLTRQTKEVKPGDKTDSMRLRSVES